MKWQSQSDFIKYWLSPERLSWYQGFTVGIPDHNNNNKSDNRYVKDDQGRKRLCLIQFLNHFCNNFVIGWSKRRAATSFDQIPFHTHPQLTLQDWCNVWQWSSLSKNIVKYKKDDRDLYYMPSGLEKSL